MFKVPKINIPRKVWQMKLIFFPADKHEVLKTASLQYLCNISRKLGRMKLIFCLQINVKGFFKLILSFYVCAARHAQITQNNKFAISLQHLKKEVSDDVHFLHANKQLLLVTNWYYDFDGDGQAFPKFSK